MNLRLTLLIVLITIGHASVNGQFLIEMVDTTKAEGKGLWTMYRKHDNLGITGYMQPQFQIAQEKGAKSYNAGNFPDRSNSRFLLRRGRIRFDYAHFTDEGLPVAQVVFQFDGTERGVFIRDFYGRFFENKFQLFTATTGMFARPFGYEVNLSSMNRESPERGRMSQILMKTERDLGFMASFEPRKKDHPLKYLKLDIGLFNGQGLAAPGEYDSYKDLISRFSLKPVQLRKNIYLSAGLSLLRGGLVQNSRYIYKEVNKPGTGYQYVLDSNVNNIGGKAPRKYYGADMQVRFNHGWGNTELRGEYWWGTQPGIKGSSETPAELVDPTQPYFIRDFNGAFFYLLQNIGNSKHQLGVKYDWYDPNSRITGKQVGEQGELNSVADIKFSTLSLGYNYYISNNTKIMFWYDMVRNENTNIPEYAADKKDNVFTCRVQFRF